MISPTNNNVLLRYADSVRNRETMMNVNLISYTPDPARLSAAAARLCYRDISASEIMEKLSEEEIAHLLELVIGSGHHSVIEHINFTFAIDGVSRVLTHQLVRHRVGIAFSQQSQRYTKLKNAQFVIPPQIAKNPKALGAFSEYVNQSFKLYETLIESGIPKEDARFVLPQSVATRIVMTVNMRQLIHMYALNSCFRVQWELRKLMGKIKKEVRRVSPRFASELRIKCFIGGYCTEELMCQELIGKMPRKEDTMSRAGYIASEDFDRLEIAVEEMNDHE